MFNPYSLKRHFHCFDTSLVKVLQETHEVGGLGPGWGKGVIPSIAVGAETLTSIYMTCL